MDEQDSIEWSHTQNIICHSSNELKMNQDSFLECSDDMIRFNIVQKIVEDDIVWRMDELNIIELNGDVIRSGHGIQYILL